MRIWLVAGAVAALATGCESTSGACDGGPCADSGTDAGGGSSKLDAGQPADAGDCCLGAGPWPKDPAKNYSQAYSLGAVQSAGLDDALNLWVLSGNRVGVLKPGDSAPRWSDGLGQAALGFTSSVICGGREGQAFVGYIAVDPGSSPDNPNYADNGFRRSQPSAGDADSVAIGADGAPALEEHINLYNSNDLHWNEAASVLTCLKVVRGPAAGDVFFGNNHGVSRMRAKGCEATWAQQPRHTGYATCYSDHRHPAWYSDATTGAWVPDEDTCSFRGGTIQCRLMVGYNYALGVAQNGDVLAANEWRFGITLTTPDRELAQWDRFDSNPWRLDWFVPELNSLEAQDGWRGFTQAVDGAYYLGSKDFGLWRMNATLRSDGIRLSPTFEQVDSPVGSISSLVATDDGSVYVGSNGSGLWRLTPNRTFERVDAVAGGQVRELRYDPRTKPAMLLALTDAGLFVLRVP